MIIDLLLALIALGGSAVLGYLIGKKTSGKSLESTFQQQKVALKKAEQSLAETVMQLTRCTRRRRDLAIKVRDLTTRLENQGMTEKTTPLAASPKAKTVNGQKSTGDSE